MFKTKNSFAIEKFKIFNFVIHKSLLLVGKMIEARQ